MVSCLLIDQNEQERRKVEQLLSGLGIDCIERQAAEDGLEYCMQQNPDVVFMDASGLPAARDFLRHAHHERSRNGRPIVILYSDEANIEAMGETILDGAAEFLIKPFDRDLLQFKLAQAGVIKQ